jgi:hypothetical protein
MSVLAESVLGTWRESPTVFASDMIAKPLRPDQLRILEALPDALARRVAFRAPRGWGKTFAQVVAGLWWIATRPDSLVLVACPSERQVRSFFEELEKVFRSSKLAAIFPEWVPLNTSLLTNRAGWGIRGMSSDSPALLEGHHAERLLLIIDEAKALPDEHFSALAGSCASSEEWRILAAGTGGSPSGWWYRAFGSERKLWQGFTFRAEDSPHLAEVIDAERQRLGKDDPQFRALYGAEFTDSRAWSMFSLDHIEKCLGIDPDADEGWPYSTFKQRTIGCDIARTGDDTVICFLRGRVVEGFAVLAPGDEMQTAGHIIEAARRWRAREIVIDESGLGHGVLARVEEVTDEENAKLRFSKENRVAVLGLNAAWRPDDVERFQNRKVELLVWLRGLLRDGKIGLPRDCERLVAELLGVRLEVGSNGRMRSVDPKPSPDFLDAMLCALSARHAEAEPHVFQSDRML